MRIILISGMARHGKDQTAEFAYDYLKQCGKRVLLTHFADFLKDFCKKNYGYRGVKDAQDREILQRVGTDIIRKNNPDAWVKMMVELLKGVKTEFDYVLIPDTRFENEINYLKSSFKTEDVITIRVIRENFDNGLTDEQKAHHSESSLINYKFDFVIKNNGTLKDLNDTIKAIIDEL